MAVIQSIRNRAGKLLAIIVGVALFAFILGDFITGGGRIIQRQRQNVVEINGDGIPFPEFEKMSTDLENIVKIQYGTKNLDENTSTAVRNQAWQSLLQDKIYTREYNKLGLEISGDELSDMIQGQNVHPFISQYFGNPETGVINRVQLNAFLQKIKEADPNSDEKKFWLYMEDMIYKQKMMEKYNTLVRQGLYATNLDAEKRKDEMSNTVDFNYIIKPYSTISDSSVSVSSSEIKEYYKEHKEQYTQEESRSLKFVEFKIIPSASDNADAEKWINEVKAEYAQVSDDEQYIKVNSDIEFDPTNYKKGELPAQLDEFMFNANKGEIFGPYFENNSYKLAKLSHINFLPDSVQISHIVLPVNQQNGPMMKHLADSLKSLAEKGYDFAELARTNSKDNSAIMGGDMGWIKEGTLGKMFSDSCFYKSKGDIVETFSQNGIHIVKIMNQSPKVKKVQVGILARTVIASDQTDQNYYTIASEFAGKNSSLTKFDAAVKNENLIAVPVNNLKPEENNIPGLDRSRQLVKWAYNAEAGDVSKVYRFGDSYVVAALVKTYEKGYTPVEELTATIEPIIKKQKKAEIIKKELEGAASGVSSLDALSNKLQLPVQTANNVKFSSYALPGLGQEPKVIAAALNMDENKLSAPIDGENGVYIIDVAKQPVADSQGMDVNLAKSYIDRNFSARVNYKSFDVLKELANVKDHRIRFF